ncbi:hypothetical protein [Caulobacter sp. RL271]|jgi:hypothetical protein|uniref:Uncharacterized protein n=1 Tax=Caulobacter segnis TaxID=88688 RepID=A0ABY4ZSE1_9CAUL|nr:hypothetical protein [Caulobacter segnis]USQ94917.1 hypothetical protein MZV50_20490 [Caulobacter segnis]
MTLIDKIPTLSDAELKQLLSNARRLDVTGTPAQRREVASVITPLEREASRRRAVLLKKR